MILKADGDAGDKTVLALDDLSARVHQKEAARAVGVLHAARFEAALAEERALLVSGGARDGDLSAVELELRLPVNGAGRSDLRENIRRNIHQLQQLLVPLQLVDIEEHRAAGIRIVRDMDPAGRELPDQPGIDRPEEELPRFGTPSGAGHMVQQPLDLRPGEVRVGHKAGLLPDGLAVAGGDQLVDGLRGAAALPDDGVRDRLSGLLVPDHRGLALVGNTDGGDILRRGVELVQRGAGDFERDVPDLVRVMLHPAGLRVDLLELFLHGTADITVVIEEDTAGTGRPLVERHDVLHADRFLSYINILSGGIPPRSMTRNNYGNYPLYCTDISEKVKVLWYHPFRNPAFSALCFHLLAGDQVVMALWADLQHQHTAHDAFSAVRADAHEPRHDDHCDHAGKGPQDQIHLLSGICLCEKQRYDAHHDREHHQHSDDIASPLKIGNMWFHLLFLPFLCLIAGRSITHFISQEKSGNKRLSGNMAV